MQTRDPRFGSRLTGRQAVAVLLVVAAVVWVLVNGPVEGPTLIVFSPSHGLTVADLPSLAAGAVAVLLVWPRRGRGPGRLGRDLGSRQRPRNQDDRHR